MNIIRAIAYYEANLFLRKNCLNRYGLLKVYMIIQKIILSQCFVEFTDMRELNRKETFNQIIQSGLSELGKVLNEDKFALLKNSAEE